MRKKLLILTLSLTLSFTACASGTSQDNDNTNQADVVTSAAPIVEPIIIPTVEPTVEPTAKPEKVFDFSKMKKTYKEMNIDGLTAKHGELLSVIYNEGTVIVKTKIEPSYNNNATIAQNYFTVADLVKNHGFNTCKKLSYWAVADMMDGTESKCISFDLKKKVIKALYKGYIVENQLGIYATDLWILPSLQN